MVTFICLQPLDCGSLLLLAVTQMLSSEDPLLGLVTDRQGQCRAAINKEPTASVGCC